MKQKKKQKKNKIHECSYCDGDGVVDADGNPFNSGFFRGPKIKCYNCKGLGIIHKLKITGPKH